MARHVFRCIDGHTAGNPVRLVIEGGPELAGDTMSARRQDFMARYDWIRTGLCFEPRGHDMTVIAFGEGRQIPTMGAAGAHDRFLKIETSRSYGDKGWQAAWRIAPR